MSSILSVDVITGVSNPNIVTLPIGIVDGTTIQFSTIANVPPVLTLGKGGIQLTHFSPAVLTQVLAQSSVALPGTIIQKAGSSQPPQTLACNGQAVSRNTYSALFGEIGTSFGNGDGTSTFTLPSMGGNFYIKF